MSAFNYQAVDFTGKKLSGVVEADSERAARAVLRERGLVPLSVTTVSETGGKRSSIKEWFNAPSRGELALSTRQLASLLEAGLSVENALQTLSLQAPSERSRAVFAAVRSEIMAGQSLHQAMATFPRFFPGIYRALVKAGELSGGLAGVLGELASHLEEREALRMKVGLALIYPAAITVIALLVVTGLLIYVVPQIVSVFQQTRQTLPWLTRALIGASNFAKLTGWIWLVSLIGLGWFFRWRYQDEHFRYRWQSWLLKLPLIGNLLRLEEAARFGNVLAILLTGGVPLLTALQTASESASTLVFRQALEAVAEHVRQGVPLHRALAEYPIFPPLLIHLAANGEASGKLSLLLAQSSRQLQRELEFRLGWLIGLFEPLLIVGMGGMVLVIVLAILLPIIDMNVLVK